jgi:hypothetical protein
MASPEVIEERRIKSLIMAEEGIAERDIARIFGVSRATVRRDLNFARATGVLASATATDTKVFRPTKRRSRITQDAEKTPLFTKIPTIVEPDDHESDWRMLELDRATLHKVAPHDLIEMLANVSPPFSRAVWDYMRLCDAGHKYDVFTRGTEETNEAGKAALGDILRTIRENYGSLKALSIRLFMNGYMRGAMLAEIVLDQNRNVVDFVVPDAYMARFRRIDDPQRGPRWQLGQIGDKAEFVPLEYPTIRYMAHDPWPGKPYGRSPAMPGLFPCLFLIGLAHDLRRVVAQQGYPRIDISLDLEKLAAAFPLVYKKGGDDWESLIDDTLNTIVSEYGKLEPEDAYVHTHDQVVNRPVGSLDGNSIQASDTLIRALERMAVQALKTMPLMFGITDGVSEANANRQWEIQAAAVKSLQHMAETIFEDLFQTGLEAQGHIVDVKWRFAELRASELQRDEQTVQLRTQNSAYMRDQGWLTDLEAAQRGLDRDPSPDVVEELKDRPIKDPSEPVEAPASAGEPNSATDDPDPGENLSVGDKVVVRMGNRRILIPLDMIETTETEGASD